MLLLGANHMTAKAEVQPVPVSAAVLRAELKSAVIGQDVVEPVVDAYVRWRAGLAGLDRPVAAFMALGPTGTGKTLLVERLAAVLHGDLKKMIKIHCAEYQHGHEVAKLIGAPPGYIGHKETQPRLSQRKIQEARSAGCGLTVVLFDEIEKAHWELWNLMLGVLDKGDLHLGDGSAADLRQTIIFLTSNVGSREIARTTGYRRQDTKTAMASVRRQFSPEFLNRLTGYLEYRALGIGELRAIARREMMKASARIAEATGLTVTWDDEVVDVIAAEALAKGMGARPIGRIIERVVELPLAYQLVGAGVDSEIGAEVKVVDGRVVVT